MVVSKCCLNHVHKKKTIVKQNYEIQNKEVTSVNPPQSFFKKHEFKLELLSRFKMF